jgi:hypothetical protein
MNKVFVLPIMEDSYEWNGTESISTERLGGIMVFDTEEAAMFYKKDNGHQYATHYECDVYTLEILRNGDY